MSGPQVMIEDYIPVEEISIESVREKLGGHHISKGMPRNLHLWWARRPLAACRAAVYAAFAPPAGGEERRKLPAFFQELCHWESAELMNRRDSLHHAREVVSTAANGAPPRVLDMFAGGGAIPLEAQRLGAQAVAVELNPVAHLIERCTLEFPQRYGQRLNTAVAKWGEWVIARTQAEVGDLYPEISIELDAPKDLFGRATGGRALRPIAFLWTRTIPSPARGFEQGMVPLVRQTWFRKKKGRYVAGRMVVDREAMKVRFEVVESEAKSEQAAIEEWGFDPASFSVRGATTCPFSGSPVTAADAKAAGKAGQMGAQLVAVVCIEPGKRGKRYLSVEQLEGKVDDLATVSGRIPPVPVQSSTGTNT